MKGFARAYMIVFPSIHMDHSTVQQDKYIVQKNMSVGMVLQEWEIQNGIGIDLLLDTHPILESGTLNRYFFTNKTLISTIQLSICILNTKFCRKIALFPCEIEKMFNYYFQNNKRKPSNNGWISCH